MPDSTEAQSPVENEPIKKKSVIIQNLFKVIVGLKILIKNPTTRWILIGNLTLAFSTTVTSLNLPDYFNFFQKQKKYSIYSAFCITFGGCTSCLLSGNIAVKLEEKTYRAKSYVSSFMCLMAVPLCLVLFLD